VPPVSDIDSVQGRVAAVADMAHKGSLLESIKVRLRPYLTQRRHLDAPYLDFFFNHWRFMRSRRGERKTEVRAN